MAMRNLLRPSRSIKKNRSESFGPNVTKAAKVLGVTYHPLPRVLNGRAAIFLEIVTRLEQAG